MPAPGAPLPRGVARVVAGRLVDQAARVDRERAALERDEPGGPDRRLARPDVGGAVAADDLDRARRPARGRDRRRPRGRRRERRRRAARPGRGAGRVRSQQALALAVPDRPEGLREPGDAHHARAQHQLGPVDAHVAPALAAAGGRCGAASARAAAASPAGRSSRRPGRAARRACGLCSPRLTHQSISQERERPDASTSCRRRAAHGDPGQGSQPRDGRPPRAPRRGRRRAPRRAAGEVERPRARRATCAPAPSRSTARR